MVGVRIPTVMAHGSRGNLIGDGSVMSDTPDTLILHPYWGRECNTIGTLPMSPLHELVPSIIYQINE